MRISRCHSTIDRHGARLRRTAGIDVSTARGPIGIGKTIGNRVVGPRSCSDLQIAIARDRRASPNRKIRLRVDRRFVSVVRDNQQSTSARDDYRISIVLRRSLQHWVIACRDHDPLRCLDRRVLTDDDILTRRRIVFGNPTNPACQAESIG